MITTATDVYTLTYLQQRALESVTGILNVAIGFKTATFHTGQQQTSQALKALMSDPAHREWRTEFAQIRRMVDGLRPL